MSAAHSNDHAGDEQTATIKPNPLEQFVLLAKLTKGAACCDLIQHALEAPGVYVFGELLAMPNVKEVSPTISYTVYLSHVMPYLFCCMVLLFFSYNLDHIKSIWIHWIFLHSAHIVNTCKIVNKWSSWTRRWSANCNFSPSSQWLPRTNAYHILIYWTNWTLIMYAN